jgi:hypothetical protein
VLELGDDGADMLGVHRLVERVGFGFWERIIRRWVVEVGVG